MISATAGVSDVAMATFEVESWVTMVTSDVIFGVTCELSEVTSCGSSGGTVWSSVGGAAWRPSFTC